MNDIVTNELGEWLRRLLYERRMTQAEVARRAGLSKTTITDIVRAQRVPSATVLRQLAVGLGGDPAEVEQFAREALHMAGYLDEPAELTNDEKISYLAKQLSQLPPEAQEMLKAQIEALAELYRRKDSQT